MSSYIDMYFERFKHRLNDEHIQNITNMYDNVRVYNYEEVFGSTDLSFNTSTFIMFSQYMSLLGPKGSGITKGTVISRERNDRIYKVNICRNDENKDLFIINFLREIYFQITFRDIFAKEGILSIIVPEIYRHGIIYNNETNDIIIFMEMHMYDFNECFLQTIIDIMPSSKAKVEAIHNYALRYYTNLKVVFDMENKYNLHHNDIVNVGNIYDFIQEVSYIDINNEADIENHYNQILLRPKYKIEYLFGGNLFNSINTNILIDFEYMSIEPFEPGLDQCRSYLSIIKNELIFKKGI
tara:strand:+ start:746 stop:1633 length:888 start_codon:yes stop_codon:yes gene_type:complete